ncbi:MAG: DNA replication/repair protein RecF [Spirochaetaceae bacterium]|nr:MAG: DNA replication/repair protein RecF [Spirochaetaceae bacterium]
MAFTSVRLYNFRNLSNATVDIAADEVFLIGENGQGKTNFLEAIYYVCYAASFRSRRDDVIRRTGEQEMAVHAAFTTGDRTPAMTHTVAVKQIGRSKEIELDGSPIADRKEIIANVPCIVFCHDDIAFVAGAPDMQRWFMNQTQSLIEPHVIGDFRTYNRVLRARNAALRDGRINLLDALDEQLATAGLPIQERRSELTRTFAQTLSHLFSMIFGADRTLELHYRPSWGADAGIDAVRAQIAQSRDRDTELRTSTRGPHRDRYPFLLDGRPLADVASTGQLRLVSLILRVAQARLLADSTGRRPVLLLDDVLLELDPDRRARFVDALPDYEQAVFTFLPDEQYARFRKQSTRTYRVEAGVLAES